MAPSLDERKWGSGDYQRDKEAALAYAEKAYQERLKHPQTNETPLPNADTSAGLIRPVGVNFYQIDEHYPSYLLCTYDVAEANYDEAQERDSFKSALRQVRTLGRQKFPPIKWIAVAVFNRLEHRNAETFEQSFKAGAVFNSAAVFESSNDLTLLVEQAVIDRRPFAYKPQTAQQQRWLVVERHASTHQTRTDSTLP